VTSVKEDLGQGPEGTGNGQRGQPAAGNPRPQAPRRWRPSLAPVVGLVRRHWLFSLVLAVAVLPRLVAMLGFRPAMLFRLDAYDYLWGAVHLSPNVINPSGYSLFLWLLLPFHSLVLVVVLQHLMGLGVATMAYAVLRHYRLPAWGATLAATPILFDPEQIMIEHLIMADMLAMTLMVGAFTVLLFRDSPSLWRSVTAGVLMGAATIVRPTVLPLVILIPIYLLIRRMGWRRAGAALLAGALPVLGYMSWFATVHGTFNMSNSNGLFLWSRTMSFANCQVIKPPPDLQELCPNEQPGHLAQANPAERALPKKYLWNHRIWAWRNTTSGFVPDTAAFTLANNARALRFALKAIEAQPVAYARTIAAEAVEPFTTTDDSLRFPVIAPSSSTLARYNLRYAIGTVKAYTGSDQGVSAHLGRHFGTRLVDPYPRLMDEYQGVFHLPGPVFGLIVLTGLVGIVIPRRRSSAAILLWVAAVIIMVLPTAEHEYTYRYVIPAVPLVCMAAALAFRKPDRRAAPAAVATSAGPAAVEGPGPAAGPASAAGSDSPALAAEPAPVPAADPAPPSSPAPVARAALTTEPGSSAESAPQAEPAAQAGSAVSAEPATSAEPKAPAEQPIQAEPPTRAERPAQAEPPA
jgi:hypothetical protein